MYQQLLALNQAVGKTTLDEVYSMTPREVDTLTAGGFQKSLNTLHDNQLVLATTMVPTAMVDPNKFTYEKVDKQLDQLQKRIQAITDGKVQKQIEKQKQEQKRFIDIFGLGSRRKGGKR